jgi:hypothetical protein
MHRQELSPGQPILRKLKLTIAVHTSSGISRSYLWMRYAPRCASRARRLTLAVQSCTPPFLINIYDHWAEILCSGFIVKALQSNPSLEFDMNDVRELLNMDFWCGKRYSPWVNGLLRTATLTQGANKNAQSSSSMASSPTLKNRDTDAWPLIGVTRSMPISPPTGGQVVPTASTSATQMLSPQPAESGTLLEQGSTGCLLPPTTISSRPLQIQLNHYRAYELWHVHQWALRDICAALREPEPYAPSTIMYVLLLPESATDSV